jgi:hypothetical protein
MHLERFIEILNQTDPNLLRGAFYNASDNSLSPLCDESNCIRVPCHECPVHSEDNYKKFLEELNDVLSIIKLQNLVKE